MAAKHKILFGAKYLHTLKMFAAACQCRPAKACCCSILRGMHVYERNACAYAWVACAAAAQPDTAPLFVPAWNSCYPVFPVATESHLIGPEGVGQIAQREAGPALQLHPALALECGETAPDITSELHNTDCASAQASESGVLTFLGKRSRASSAFGNSLLWTEVFGHAAMILKYRVFMLLIRY